MTTALITGGNRGLGRAVAETLAERDSTVGPVTRVRGHRPCEAAREWGNLDPARRHRSCVVGRGWQRTIACLINNDGVLPEATSEAPEAVDLGLFQQTTHSDRSM